MKTPLFSILIANYNNGKYLKDAIESVRQQTYANWEIILVDDGSTDNSWELYKELKNDKNIHIYLNEKNMGCGYTKRRCAEMAHGEICGFLDPDDAIVPDAMQIMVNSHLEHDSASLIYSQMYICDVKLNILYVNPDSCQIPTNSSFLEFGRGAISHFVSFKRDSYYKTTGISEYILRAVDHDLYYKLEEVGEVIYVPKPLYKYRIDTGLNISLGKNALKSKYWDVIIMAEACKRRNLPIEKIAFAHIYELNEEYAYQRELAVRHTKAYKLGKLILKPLKSIIKR